MIKNKLVIPHHHPLTISSVFCSAKNEKSINNIEMDYEFIYFFGFYDTHTHTHTHLLKRFGLLFLREREKFRENDL
jgi:hypothetical protein